ncbi:MAG: hypothetical protein K2Q33_00465 [Gammaproteobacteria bacterium]|nr:hypothetical protein [Gammaproteobacteria bacterium]
MLISTPPEITLVLGSGRSGTSAVAKGLQALGCYLGDNLTPAGPMNPKGFFEDHAIVYEISEKIIARLGHTWNSLNPFDLSSIVLSDLQEAAEAILIEKFKLSSWCGFKDPRTSRLLAFWQPLFQKMALRESYVLALRNPLSSIASFEKYDGIDRSKGFWVWLNYIISAISSILDKTTVVVNYEELLINPKKQLERMHTGLKCTALMDTTLITEYSDNFLDTTLSRNQFSYEEFKNNPEAPALCIKIYDLLNLVALDKLAFNSNEFKTQWKELCACYNNFLDNFSSINRVLDRSMEKEIEEKISRQQQQIAEQQVQLFRQEAFITELLNSRSWRWTKPFRKIASYTKKNKVL